MVPTNTPRWWTVLGWAAYLACSWTWCIGMFLPVLLRRDFGPASFWVFAVPNVVGAALMGVVLHRSGASAEFLRRHAIAVTSFTIVTCFFQANFLIGQEGLAWPETAAFSVTMLLTALTASGRFVGWWSVVVWGSSIAIGAWWYAHTPRHVAEPAPLFSRHHLIPLGVVCFFGFALCPYLDATFHWARRALAGTAGSWAFVIGFALLFFALILLTNLYAPSLLATDGSPRNGIRNVLLLHVAIQLGFTTGAHATTVQRVPWSRPNDGSTILLPFAAAIGIGAFANVRPLTAFGLSGFELVYRSFMVFYGLVFPAYVLLCTPRRDTAGPSRRQYTVLALAVVAAVPFYWLGFIERRTWWLLPGVGLVLLARLFIGRAAAASPPAPPSPSPSPAPAPTRPA